MLENELEDFKGSINDVITKIKEAQLSIFLSANVSVIDLYFNIGKIIEDKAKWGNKFIDELSIELKINFPNAKGYSPRNLHNMKKFYLAVKDDAKLKEYSYKIPWSHNLLIINKINDNKEKIWYIQETYNNGWSYDYLDIQIKRCL